MGARVGVVVPVFNEGSRPSELIQRMPPVVATAFVVDDGSTDEGCSAIATDGVVVIRHGSRRGIGSAIRDGLDAARADGCTIAVVMAGNGKDRPEEIPSLVARILDGSDYVQGSRFMRGGHSVRLPFIRGLLIRSFTVAFRILVGFPGTDVTNGFRAYRLALFDDPRIRLDQPWLDGYELEYYLHWKVITLGYNVCEVAVSKTYPGRSRSYSKIRPIVDWWRMVRTPMLLALGIRS